MKPGDAPEPSSEISRVTLARFLVLRPHLEDGVPLSRAALRHCLPTHQRAALTPTTTTKVAKSPPFQSQSHNRNLQLFPPGSVKSVSVERSPNEQHGSRFSAHVSIGVLLVRSDVP